MDLSVSLIKSLLKALYAFLMPSLMFAFMFMYMYKEIKKGGFRKTVSAWLGNFRNNKEFRRIFALAFYIMMILFRTVLCREVKGYPLRYVMGIWGLHYPDGSLYTDGVANFIFFIPMTVLLMWALKDRIFRNRKLSFWSVLAVSLAVSFAFSFGIETLQLFMKLGTVQLSDLCYNTLGGGIGGIIYYIIYRIKHKEKNQ